MTTKSDTPSIELRAEKPAKAVQQAPSSPKPKIILPLGRGGRGKSFLSRWLIDRAQSRGGEIVVADADRTNPSLEGYLSPVQRPPSSDERDMQQWFKALCKKQVADRFDMLIDLGGGDLFLKQLARKIDLVPFLEKQGVEVVAIHLIGAQRDDLTYLRDLEENRLVAPAATILVLNEDAAPKNLSTEEAFRPVLEHSVFKAAVARGARLAWMPILEAAHELEARRLLFTAAEAGLEKDDAAPLDVWDQQVVHMWLRAMEKNFAHVAQWLA